MGVVKVIKKLNNTQNMADGGLKVDDSVLKAFDSIKSQDNTKKFVICKISGDNQKITVDCDADADDFQVLSTREKDTSYYDHMLNRLPSDSPRYIFYKIDYTIIDKTNNKLVRDKLSMINYCPSGTKIQQKMIMASTKATLKKAVNFQGLNIDAFSEAEVQIDSVANALQAMPNVSTAGPISELEDTKITWDAQRKRCSID